MAQALAVAAEDARATAKHAAELGAIARTASAAIQIEVAAVLEASLVASWRADEATATERAAQRAAEKLHAEAQRADLEARKCMHSRDGCNPDTESPTGGHRVRRGLWDVQVAIHCASPTNNVQPPTIEDAELEMVEVSAQKKRQADNGLAEMRRRLHESKEEWKRLVREVEAAEKAQAAASAEEQRVATWRVKDSESRSKRTHDEGSTHAAWIHVLRPLEAKLHQLHESDVIEAAVFGYVRSDAEAWRRFWTRRSDARSQCVAPRECHCALCSARGHWCDRSGAKSSEGKDGVFVHTDGVGTRVMGVVRMRAPSPGAAMDLLCEHLVTTLHESHGPVMSTAGKDVSDRAHRE